MEPYRPEPSNTPLARIEGNELLVPDGERLPRACVLCGTTRKLVVAEHTLVWQPALALLLAVFGIFGRLLVGAAQRTATLTYATCKPCALRARDRRDLLKAVFVGILVVAIVAATVGFNGYPVIGIAIAVVAAPIIVVLVRALSRGQISVAYIHGDGTIHLRGVSAEVARRALENRKDAAGNRLDDDD